MKKSSKELLNVSNEDYKPNIDIDGGSKQAETTNDTIILDNVKSSQSINHNNDAILGWKLTNKWTTI